MRKTIAIFGAGKAGSDAYQELKRQFKIEYFVDNTKRGIAVDGIEIYGPEILASRPVDIIFICSMYAHEIKTQLRSAGIWNFQTYQKRKNFKSLRGPLKTISLINTTEVPLYLIYQVGKVGSNSIVNRLAACGAPAKSIHTFRSTDVIPQWNLKLDWRSEFEYRLSSPLPWLAKRAITSREKQKRDTFIITGVRDPVSRAISIVMQSLHFLLKEHLGIAYVQEDRFIDIFQEILHQRVNLDYYFQWFEQEFAYVTGFHNVHQREFCKQKGIGVSRREHTTLVVFRQDKLPSLLNSNFDGLLPTETHKSKSANRSENKWYACLSDDVKSKLILNKAYLETVYNSDYCKSFFTEQERQDLIKKWSQK